jgi:GT2 family glycosyltransferase
MPPNKELEFPLISIITLNYNQTDVTCLFLESTKNLSYPNIEIIVCDMNSDEDPTQKINSVNLPNVQLILSDVNLGFASGNNLGMSNAKGEYVFIVNNDTEVTPGLLNELMGAFKKDASIGVVSPKIKYYDHPDTIQYAGFNKMNMYTGRTSTIGDKEKDHGQHDMGSYTWGAHGCAMLVKKEVIHKTGRFPAVFFLYYEEWDWSCRIRNAGFHIYYEPKAVIYHKESMSVGKESTLKTFYLNRNRILFIRRNSNALQCVVFFIYYLLFAIPKNILAFGIKKQLNHLRAYLKAVAWNFTHSTASEL